MILVGTLVLGEAGVAIDAEQGAVDLGLGHDGGRDLRQPAAHGHDKGLGRLNEVLLVDVFVVVEPLLGVVILQVS